MRFVHVLLVSLFGLLGFSFAQQGLPLVKVTDTIYLYGTFAFSMFVVTSDGVVVVDPVDAVQATKTAEAIRSVTDQPVKYVVYSHNHWDHISGGQVFKEQGATFISHIAAKEGLKPNPEVVMPDFTWTGNRYDLVVGDTTMELYYFGASHGEGMTVFRLPDDDVLFTADLVTPDRVGFMDLPDFDVAAWIATLKEMEKLEFTTALFGHNAQGDKPPVGGRAEVTAQREYLEALTTATGQALAAGQSPTNLDIVLPAYKDWAFYDEWLSLNATTVALQMYMGY